LATAEAQTSADGFGFSVLTFKLLLKSPPSKIPHSKPHIKKILRDYSRYMALPPTKKTHFSKPSI
jgi:hypothetical protein